MAVISIKLQLRDSQQGDSITKGTTNTNLNSLSIPLVNGVFEENPPANFRGSNVVPLTNINQQTGTGGIRFNSEGNMISTDGNVGNLQSQEEKRFYMWGIIPSTSLYDITINISDASGITSIVLIGDYVANQFPTEAIVDGNTIYSDDPKWVIKIESSSTHTIRITKWNRPNYYACLTAIRATTKSITYSNSGIESLKTITQYNNDATNINYGCMDSSGSVDFVDYDGEIQDLLNDDIIQSSNIPVDISINNNVLTKHITNDSTYDTADSKYSISLAGKIKDFDVLKFSGMSYPEHSMTLYEILKVVMDEYFGTTLSTADFNAMLNNKCVCEILENNVLVEKEDYIYNYIAGINVEYPVIESGFTYRQIIDDICTMAQLNMYEDSNGNFKFISARPLLLSTDNPIRITKSSMVNPNSHDVILKNKYDGIEISENKVNVLTNTNSNIYSWKSTLNEYTITNNNNSDTKTWVPLIGTSFTTHAKVTATYYNGTVTIPKKTNYNLNIISSIKNGVDGNNEPEIKYNLNYIKKTGGITVIYLDSTPFFSPSYTQTSEGNSSLANYSNISATYHNATATIPDETNLKFITITEDVNNFYFTFKILVAYSKLAGSVENNTHLTDGSSEAYYVKPNSSVDISVYGIETKISFKDSSVSENIDPLKTINEATTKANIQSLSTHLLQDKTTIGTGNDKKKISSVIKENIFSDYEYGISNYNIELFATDLKYADGQTAKQLSNGQLVNVGDSIFISGDKNKFGLRKNLRAYSRKLDYQGQPITNIMAYELTYYGFEKLVMNGKIILTTDKNAIVYVNTSVSGRITVPNYITELLSYSFSNCTNIIKITIPNTVTKIGSYTFSGCSGLTGLLIPSSVTTIGETILEGCTALESLEFPYVFGTQTNSNSNMTYLFGSSGAPCTLKTVVINSAIDNSIGEYAFMGCNSLMSIILPINLVNIGKSAFYGCSSLTEFEIPSSVTSIGNRAFNYCTNLTSITFEDTTGWKFNGSAIDVSNPQTNATNLNTDGIWSSGISKT